MEIEHSLEVMAAPTYEGKRKQKVGGPKSKRRKLEPLVDWGEAAENDIWKEWLSNKEQMSKKTELLNSKEDNMPNLRLKQMELNFKKIPD